MLEIIDDIEKKDNTIIVETEEILEEYEAKDAKGAVLGDGGGSGGEGR